MNLHSIGIFWLITFCWCHHLIQQTRLCFHNTRLFLELGAEFITFLLVLCCFFSGFGLHGFSHTLI
ncbi:Uncharacterised protein [Vibrio cholerae]|uniref:Uncharacterized protein n=1 Tax=Vibrio cholerae TaxID=666 RepID=A0A656A2C7_VIBCL|nr:Uncharacterised protein [Vibrio cholerae]